MVEILKRSNGIECNNSRISIRLDPKLALNGINFTSHAHTDHLPSTRSTGTVLCTKETADIAKARGNLIQNTILQYNCTEMIPSGHVFGGCGLLFDDVFYTADICTRNRPGIMGAKIPKCKTLITECTFGKPQFIFSPIEEMMEKVNQFISKIYSRGIPVILMGYEVGKAQTLCKMFGHWKPLYYHERIKKINDVCRSLGADIPDAISFNDAEKSNAIQNGPWILVAPMLSSTNSFVKRLKSEYGAITIGFSGWAAMSNNKLAHRCDKMFAYSDHCDYMELLHIVEESCAKTVYTVHGFTHEFARTVRNTCGVDAYPLE
ncbi:MAG: exonuclease [Cenarchaeum symbiont of Oopsacas minuta]|nr:exonuclease [Cenarchaeum symbiont of Oopsacas minuta]